MALMKLWKAIARAVAALLLMVATVTPALAEIGCAEESLTHLEEGLSAGEHAAELASAGQSDDQDEQSTPRGHCAFSHGHCAGILPVSSRAAELPRMAAAYGLTRVTPLAPTSPDTSERPPNA
jgi:hypothetical protein